MEHQRKKRKNVQTAVRFAVCIPLIAGFSAGCAGDGTPAESAERSGLTAYTSADAAYTMTFDGGRSGTCERTGGTTVLRMTSPERLCGITVTYDGHVCSLAVEEMSVLLSPEAAAGLTEIFDLLARPMEDGGVPTKSADGTQTVVTFEAGSVTLGGDGVPGSGSVPVPVPVEVTYDGRTVKIGDYTIQ